MDLLYRVKTLWAALRGNHYTWPAIDISLPGDGTTSENDLTEGTESVEETETAETEKKDSEEETKSTEKDSETTDKSTDKDVTSDYLSTLSDLITSLNK